MVTPAEEGSPTDPRRTDERTLLVRQLAHEAFGAEADTWLRTPSRRLHERTPDEVMATDDGVRAIERVLRRVLHGLNA